MLHLQQSLLPADQLTILKKWLDEEGARILVRYLENKAATRCAQAGNLMFGEPKEAANLDDAREVAEEARQAKALIDLLHEMKGTDYQFVLNQFIPAPSTTTEQAD